MILDWKIFTPIREMCELLDKIVPLDSDKANLITEGLQQLMGLGYVLGFITGVVVSAGLAGLVVLFL